MEDRSAASVGVVLAGIALAAAAFPWDGAAQLGPVNNAVLGVLAAAAFGTFALRRHGLLGRQLGAAFAGVASLSVVGYVVLALSGVVTVGSGSLWGVSLALLGGVGGVVAAYGDGRGLSDRLRRGVAAVVQSFVLGFSGLFAITAWGVVLLSFATAVVPGEPSTTVRLGLGAVALGLGTGTVALVYFRLTDTPLSYLDFRTPTMRDLGYVAVGVVALFGLQLLVSVAFTELGLTTADHSVEQATTDGNATVLLLLIPASWLIIGPGEELLYRNIIQKSLYDTFGEWGAVFVGSVVFALAHIPAYAAGASLPALANTLAVIFLLSLILGATYLRTENLTVSALIHGTFDAIIFAALYVQATGSPSAAAILP